MKIERLEKLLAYYRPETVTDFTQITIGISNDAYVVTCASGDRYVIRIIHLQTAESARAEALIQQTMHKHGIATPLYLQLTDGAFVGHDGADTFTIAAYISGEHPEHASPQLVRSLGAVMAKLHNILDQDKIAIGYNIGQWLNPRNVAADMARCSAGVQKRLQPIIDETLHIFDENLPLAVIHGDLSANNTFAEDDHVTTIFDFETTEFAPRILDIAYSYLSFICDGELVPAAILTALKTGYNNEAETPITPQEKASFRSAIQYVSAATAAWCFSRGYDEYGESFLRAGEEPATSAGILKH